MKITYKPSKKKQVLLLEPKKQIPNTVRNSNKTVLEDVIQPLDNCYNLSEKVLENVISQEITLKMKKEGQKPSPVRKKSAITSGLLFLLALTGTLVNISLHFQIGLYLLAFSVQMYYDSLSLFCLVLSQESRKIISFLTVMVAVGFVIFRGFGRYWLVVAILAAVGLCVVGMLNYRWMKYENYCMTESVEGAIVNNPESIAYQAYLNHGKKKCRTLAFRQNFQFNEKILDGCFGLFWRMGYWDGWKKTEQVNVTIADLTSRAEKAENEVREVKEELTMVKKQCAQAEKERDRIKEQVDGSKWSAEYYEKLYNQISKENLRLSQTNEELLTMLNKESTAADLPEVATVSRKIQDDGEDRARELLKQGCSIRKTVELSGVSFYNVNRIRKELIESGEITTDGKIVSIKSAAS